MLKLRIPCYQHVSCNDNMVSLTTYIIKITKTLWHWSSSAHCTMKKIWDLNGNPLLCTVWVNDFRWHSVFSASHAHWVKPFFSAKGLIVTARRRVLNIKEQCLRKDRKEKVSSYRMVEMARDNDFIIKFLINNKTTAAAAMTTKQQQNNYYYYYYYYYTTFTTLHCPVPFIWFWWWRCEGIRWSPFQIQWQMFKFTVCQLCKGSFCFRWFQKLHNACK